MIRSFSFLFALCLLGNALFVGCADTIDDSPINSNPDGWIDTHLVDELTIKYVTTASFGYEVSVAGDIGATIGERGICYSTKPNPTIDDNKTSNGDGLGKFSGGVYNLTPNTVYYVRGYATSLQETIYGRTIEVVMCKEEGLIGAEEAFPGMMREVVSTVFRENEIRCSKIYGQLFYQGDILIGSANRTVERTNENWKWPNNTVYYVIDPDFPLKERIDKALALFSKANIIFKERIDEPNYILFKYIPNGGCYSFLGMVGGAQEVVIDNWAEAGSIAHEIMHALGFLHQHANPNRDDFIMINHSNIIENYEHNFNVFKTGVPIYNQEFDFNSLMCCHSWLFASDKNHPTIMAANGSVFKAQRQYLSQKDVDLINSLYFIDDDINMPPVKW